MPDPTSPPPPTGPGVGAGGPDRLADWLSVLHRLYPPSHAEGWDAVGLHVGDTAQDTVAGVLVSLDVTQAVLDEAADRGCDLLVAHHPLLFRPLDRLTGDSAPGRLALTAARRGIAVAAAHTNLDKADPGTSHPAAAALGLRDVTPLQPLDPDPQVKLVTFVPVEHTSTVRAALGDAGAGVIGDYDACAFTTPGTGTFRPGADADPFLGERGELAEVAEHRVEVVLPRARQRGVLAALRSAHPYEEVPVDLYPLLPTGPSSLGLGLIGDLPRPTPLAELVDSLAAALQNPLVRLAAADRTGAVTRVAIVGGAGGSLIDVARRAGAEVIVTGDVGHHVALDALTMGVAVIDAGHFGTEWPAMQPLAAALDETARAEGMTAPVHRSTVNTDPWTDWSAPPGAPPMEAADGGSPMKVVR